MVITKARHAQILDMLREDHAVLVRELARKTGVSESTIRRDLAQLESLGYIRRIHGGAFLDEGSETEPPFELREISHRHEKDLVGQAAAPLVRDGDVIFIDGGTTTQFIIPYIEPRRNLTVVTCGLNIAEALNKSEHIHTIVVGGELHVESQSFTGSLALQALEAYNIHCDGAFIGIGGVSVKDGLTNRILDRIPLKRKAMEISRWVAVVADGSKVGAATLGHVAPLQAMDHLVTDPSAPKEELEAIAAKGIQIRMVEQTRVREEAASQ